MVNIFLLNQHSPFLSAPTRFDTKTLKGDGCWCICIYTLYVVQYVIIALSTLWDIGHIKHFRSRKGRHWSNPKWSLFLHGSICVCLSLSAFIFSTILDFYYSILLNCFYAGPFVYVSVCPHLYLYSILRVIDQEREVFGPNKNDHYFYTSPFMYVSVCPHLFLSTFLSSYSLGMPRSQQV